MYTHIRNRDLPGPYIQYCIFWLEWWSVEASITLPAYTVQVHHVLASMLHGLPTRCCMPIVCAMGGGCIHVMYKQHDEPCISGGLEQRMCSICVDKLLNVIWTLDHIAVRVLSDGCLLNSHICRRCHFMSSSIWLNPAFGLSPTGAETTIFIWITHLQHADFSGYREMHFKFFRLAIDFCMEK